MGKLRVGRKAGQNNRHSAKAGKKMRRQGLSAIALLLSILFNSYAAAQQTETLDSIAPLVEKRVTAVAMTDVWIQPMQRVTAEVTALNHAQVSAQANGEVLKVGVEVGDRVTRGKVLIELDCRQSELSEAVLNDVLNLARNEYKRAQSLQKSKTIAEQEITRLQSTLEQARIRILQAELAVEHCLIKAPFDGVVTARQVQLGMIATAGAPMLKLLQVDAVEVVASLGAMTLNSLQDSNNIRFESAGKSYALKVRTALPLIDPASNKQRIRLAFVDDRPFSGAAGMLVWPAGGQYLPANLLIERQGGLGYFIAEGDIARFVSLPDAAIGHPALLGPGSEALATLQVVLEGRFKLKDGDRIALVTPEQ